MSGCVGKTTIGHPNEPVSIRYEMRRLRMWFGAIKDIRDRFTFSGRKRRYVHERLYTVIRWASDHSVGIRVSHKDCRPTRSLEDAL